VDRADAGGLALRLRFARLNDTWFSERSWDSPNGLSLAGLDPVAALLRRAAIVP